MTGKEILFFDEHSIQMSHHPSPTKHYVMHIGERSLMHSLADLSTSVGGHILEVGFGMGISANRIQENKSVLSHTIIEVHPDVFSRAVTWAKDKPSVTILLGDWIDVIPNIKDKKFDGVLHDTCADPNINKFIDIVTPICNKNCIVTFFLNRNDEELNTFIHKFEDEDYDTIPYKNISDFKDKTYKLKYKIIT